MRNPHNRVHVRVARVKCRHCVRVRAVYMRVSRLRTLHEVRCVHVAIVDLRQHDEIAAHYLNCEGTGV